MNNMKTFWIISLLLALGLIVYFPGGQLARSHVNEKTAVTDHPLNCASCHLYISKNKYLTKLVNEEYLSPLNLEISKDGKYLYVVAQDGDALLKVDAENREVLNKVQVGDHPHSVLLNETNEILYVSNQWSDNVSVIDASSFIVIDTIETGNGPAGLSLSPDQKDLYVANTFGSNVSVIELATEREKRRLPVGDDPTGMSISPDGKSLLVTSRRAQKGIYGQPLVTDLTLIDPESNRIKGIRKMKDAYLIENVSFTPASDLALTTLIRPKNNIPSVQVTGGWMMTHGIGVIDMVENGKTAQLLLDEQNAYYPDPFDVVISPDGKKAYVSSSGVNVVSVISVDSLRSMMKGVSQQELDEMSDDLGVSSRFVIGRIKTGASPKGMAMSPDGRFLYVTEQLEDRIAVIDAEQDKSIGFIELGGPDRITVARQGRRLFASAGHTFQNQYSCYTCHPDNHEDGLVYNMAGKDMGRNLANTQSLREIGDTAPFKWNGKNQTVYKQDGMQMVSNLMLF